MSGAGSPVRVAMPKPVVARSTRPGRTRWGVRGQRIIVDPQSKLVMVNTAVHRQAVDVGPLREMGALWRALVEQLGG